MANQNTVLSFEKVNFSLQIGDVIYFTTGGVSVGGFNSSQLQNTKKLGNVVDIEYNDLTEEFDITVRYDDVKYPSASDLPSSGQYISFVKDKRVNTTSLLGYYASINFVNDSKEKAELFSFGSEFSESSK
tara:strand:+ start:10579 stop:10968 length:390 start_codon:yes stop_codon:yes gene_type:complete